MNKVYSELSAAMDAEITLKVLDLLVEVAEHHLRLGDAERAAEILALVLQYPLHETTQPRAAAMWDTLLITQCPRVIMDASARALELTLEDMVTLVLGGATE